jgi:alcohol dehydrogenase (cytochrome c)
MEEVKRWGQLALAITLCIGIFFSRARAAEPLFVTDDMLLHAAEEPNNWLMYGRDYSNTRFSPLSQINAQNVHRLVPKWVFQFGVLDGQTTTPVVNNGVMYVTSSWSHLFALDASTGEMLWRYDHQLPEEIGKYLCCDAVNRGVAVYHDKVYLATLDSHVVALDAKTGKPAWNTTLADYKEAYTMTVAPLVVKGKVIVGMSGSEYPIRLFIAALDAETGHILWKRYTIPTAGENGSETWGGDSWKRGGGSAWVTGSYDPALNLVYWGVGNPAPDWDGAARPGDNLYTASTLALDANTGEIRFYFQYTPHDVWDFDGVNEAVLLTLKGHQAWLHADRNGFLYAIDRKSGEFIYGRPFVETNWATLDANGRPVVNKSKVPTRDYLAEHVCPGPNGGKEWNPMAISPLTGYVYIPTREVCVDVQGLQQSPISGQPYWGVKKIIFHRGFGQLLAANFETGNTAWAVRFKSPVMSGVLATGGHLVFAGTPEGKFIAFNDKTGQQLWKFSTGSGIVGGPITFVADGKQYVAVPSGLGGWMGWATIGGGGAPWLKDVPKGGALFVFGLPD